MRSKRGLVDTSEPGGLYKDQVYLEGAIKILRERKSIDFVALYTGKISVEDLKRPFLVKYVFLADRVLNSSFVPLEKCGQTRFCFHHSCGT